MLPTSLFNGVKRLLSAVLTAAMAVCLSAVAADQNPQIYIQYHRAFAEDSHGDVSVNISVNYPRVEGLKPSVSRQLNRALYDCAMATVKEFYLDPAQESEDYIKEADSFYIFMVTVDSRVNFYNGELLSMVFDETVTLGSLYSTDAGRRCLTVNVRSGQVYGLRSILSPSEDLAGLWKSKMSPADLSFAEAGGQTLEQLLSSSPRKDTAAIQETDSLTAGLYIDEAGRVFGNLAPDQAGQALFLQNRHPFTREELSRCGADRSFMKALSKGKIPLTQYAFPYAEKEESDLRNSLQKEMLRINGRLSSNPKGRAGRTAPLLPPDQKDRAEYEIDLTVEEPWHKELEYRRKAEELETLEQEKKAKLEEKIWAEESPEQGFIFRITDHVSAERGTSLPLTCERTHIAESGDSLWRLAEQCYDDGRKYTRLLKENPSLADSPDLLVRGQEVLLPVSGYLYMPDYLIDSIELTGSYLIRSPFLGRPGMCVYDSDYMIVGSQSACVAMDVGDREGGTPYTPEDFRGLIYDVKQLLDPDSGPYTYDVSDLNFEFCTLGDGTEIYGFYFDALKNGKPCAAAVYFRYTQNYLAEFVGYTNDPAENDAAALTRLMAMAFVDEKQTRAAGSTLRLPKLMQSLELISLLQ